MAPRDDGAYPAPLAEDVASDVASDVGDQIGAEKGVGSVYMANDLMCGVWRPNMHQIHHVCDFGICSNDNA